VTEPLQTGACVADDARTRYTEGWNCAEAVLSSLSSRPGVPPLSAGIGSGFTSGIGNTGCVCGALAGGVMVLSAYVDTLDLEPVARRVCAEELSAEFLNRFTSEWGATCCRTIKRGMVDGSDRSATHCASITEFSAAAVASIIAQQTARPRAWVVRDAANAARRSALDVLAGITAGLFAGTFVPAFSLEAVATGAAVGGTVALVAEWRGARSRAAGRMLRTAGVLAAAGIALAGAFVPAALAEALSVALSPDAGLLAVFLRVATTLAALVVAGLTVYEYRRFR